MLAIIILILMVLGTFFYHSVEGWGVIDSFYFSSISLSTRGYGELHPTTTLSKLFTVFYLFIGVTFLLYALSSLIGYFMQYHEPLIKRKVNRFVNKISPQKRPLDSY
ncbi:MAG: potassium channel family protein [Nanoarchaeota archaeon]|nr:potassium channel family protein [Nanoarchaeota archaeon]